MVRDKGVILTRTWVLSKGTEYMSIVGSDIQWFSDRIVVVTTESKGTPVELNLFKLKLSEEPVLCDTSSNQPEGHSTAICPLCLIRSLATTLKAVRILYQSFM